MLSAAVLWDGDRNGTVRLFVLGWVTQWLRAVSVSIIGSASRDGIPVCGSGVRRDDAWADVYDHMRGRVRVIALGRCDVSVRSLDILARVQWMHAVAVQFSRVDPDRVHGRWELWRSATWECVFSIVCGRVLPGSDREPDMFIWSVEWAGVCGV